MTRFVNFFFVQSMLHANVWLRVEGNEEINAIEFKRLFLTLRVLLQAPKIAGEVKKTSKNNLNNVFEEKKQIYRVRARK